MLLGAPLRLPVVALPVPVTASGHHWLTGTECHWQRCGAVRCGAVRCGAVRCGAVPPVRVPLPVAQWHWGLGATSGIASES